MEKRWRAACESENQNFVAATDTLNYAVFPLLPTDSELVAAFVERKRRLVQILLFIICYYDYYCYYYYCYFN